MRTLGMQGVIRGKPVRTAHSTAFVRRKEICNSRRCSVANLTLVLSSHSPPLSYAGWADLARRLAEGRGATPALKGNAPMPAQPAATQRKP